MIVKTALGKESADLVLKHCTLIDVNTAEVREDVDIAIKGDRIAIVGDVGHTMGPNTRTIDVKGLYVAPGFMDAHIHIESTRLTPYSFGWTVIRYGTTAVFIDPHEIANVAGDRGIRLMIRDGYRSPLKFFVTYPSCVPAAANIDTSGAVFTSKDIEKGLRRAEVVALGEMMNFPGVISCNNDVLEKIGLALRLGYVIEGHIVGVSKRELAAYFASGISSDHESIECAEAIEKLRHGIYLYARESAFSKDLRTIVRCILDKKMDTRHLVLVSDDVPAEELVSRGHVDNLLRLAIETGLDPIRAIQAVTINVAEHYGLSLELGSLAPLRFGDIAVFEGLETVRIKHVISDGQIIVYNGELVVDKPRRPRYPKWATNTVILPKGLSIDRLRILVDEHEGRVKVHVMKPEALITRDLHIEMRVVDGEVTPDPDRDIARISVIERHGKDGGVGNGFIMGLGLRSGALASTVSHDSHNIVVAGMDLTDMWVAIKEVARIQGGFVMVNNGRVLGSLRLNIAGLMSSSSADKVSSKLKKLLSIYHKIGGSEGDPFAKLLFISLPVIPELKLTNKGYVDVLRGRLIDPIIHK